jgi:hypothetical protein
MSSIYIKARLKELDDDRVVSLPAPIFRLLVLLRLLAGVEDKDGELPRFGAIAWRLHYLEGQLEADMDELLRLGFLERSAETWRLINFSEEQAPLTTAERSRGYHQRHKTPATESGEDATKRGRPLGHKTPATESGEDATKRGRPLVVVQEQDQDQEQDQEQEQGKEKSRESATKRDETSQAVVVARLGKLSIEPVGRAEDLVQEYGPEYIQEKIDVYLHAIRAHKATGPGWLIRAIREDWKDAVPPDPDGAEQRQRYAEQVERATGGPPVGGEA